MGDISPSLRVEFEAERPYGEAFNGHFPSDTVLDAGAAGSAACEIEEAVNIPFPPSETSSSSPILRVRRNAGQGCKTIGRVHVLRKPFRVQ